MRGPTIFILLLLSSAVTATQALSVQSLVDDQRSILTSFRHGDGFSPMRSEPESSAKVRRLEQLKRASLADVRIHDLSPAPRRLLGDSCETAVNVIAGERFEYLAGDGHRGWFYLRSDKPVEISTFGSDVDTLLRVHAGCSDTERTEYDDNLGLAAIASVLPGAYWIEVQQAGDGLVRVGTTPGFLLGGAVTETATDSAIEDFQSALFTQGGDLVSTGGSAGNRYQFSVQEGGYLVAAGSLQSHRSRVYPDVNCLEGSSYLPDLCGGVLSGGTIIEIADTNVGDADIALPAYPRVSGRVFNEFGQPRQNIRVTAYPNEFSSSYTDSQGRFSIYRLDPTTAYQIEATGVGFRSELYDGISCTYDCEDEIDMGLGTPVNPAPDFLVDGIIFSLDPASQLTVQIQANSPGPPLNDVDVFLYRTDGDVAGSARTDMSGVAVFDSLQPGDYFVIAGLTTIGDIERTSHPDVPCLSGLCSGTATPVSVGSGEFTATMSVRRRGIVRGTVDRTEISFDEQVCWVDVVNQGGGQCAELDPDGAYELAGVRENSYVYFSSNRYVRQIFDGVNCDESFLFDCNFSAGTAIAAGPDTIQSGVDFAPQVLPTFSIQTVDSVTGLPVAGHVCLREDSSFATVLCSFGEERTFLGLSPGDYWITGEATEYATMAYPDILCESDPCAEGLASGARVSWTNTQSVSITLELTPLAEVIVAGALGIDGEPAQNAQLCIRDTGTQEVECDSADRRFLSPSTVQLALVAPGYKARLIGGSDCVSSAISTCDWTQATIFDLDFGDRQVITEDLTAEASLTIAITNPGWFPFVSFYSESGARLYGPTANDSRTLLGQGRYKVIVEGNALHCTDTFDNHYLDQVACLDNAPTIVVGLNDHQERDVTVKPTFGIFGTVTDDTGTVLPGILVDLWTEDGLYATSETTRADGFYFFNFMTSTPFALSTRDVTGRFISQVFPGINCADGTSPFTDDCALSGETVMPIALSPLSNEANFTLSLSPSLEVVFQNGFE